MTESNAPVVGHPQSAAEDLTTFLTDLGLRRVGGFGAARWAGSIGDRHFELSISRQSQTRYSGKTRYRKTLGLRLRVKIATSLRTRLFFVRAGFARSFIARWIYRWRRFEVVEQMPQRLRNFRVVALDRPWAQHLLANRQALAAVADLLIDDAATRSSPSVYFLPDELHYASSVRQREDFTVERVSSFLQTLESLARSSETLPAPRVAAQLSRFERLSRERPRAAALWLIGLIFGLILLLSAAVIGVGRWLAMR